MKAVTINTNSWTNVGHALNHLYDLLFMMGRDDIHVGAGGEDGISEDGTIFANVGGYLPIIEQPLKNCDLGNLFSDYTSNPYAEFNIFLDPFAAYQVIHSQIPITLVPLDATNTIPMTKDFFETFEKNQKTYEAQYCFRSLKMARTGLSDDQFYTNYFMWDSLMVGIAVSIMRNPYNERGENDFAEMEYMNITVHTSNKPHGVSDGSNPFFNGRKVPKFQLKKRGVHDGHVQRSLYDTYCLVKNKNGRCKDGYTEEITGPEGVRILVATKAKPNKDHKSILNREFFQSFLDVLNHPHQSGRFNFTTQFRHYKKVLHKPDFKVKKLGKPVIFDMDMSAGDFIALLYLLKVPTEILNLKAIFVTPTGWANAATIDVVYDLLHMMGRDDIPVGLGDFFGMNQAYSQFSIVGDCKYVKAIPQGSGGFLDSDTLYGLARELPRSPRRYMPNNVTFNTQFNANQRQQPLIMDIWEDVTKKIDDPQTKITILTNGPLTTISKIIAIDQNAVSKIQDLYVLGGHIHNNTSFGGNLFTTPMNKYAEFNIFLDPFSAKKVMESKLPITLITWDSQKKVSSFFSIIQNLSRAKKTPEVIFANKLISTLSRLHKEHHRYKNVDTFIGEILGAVILASGPSLNSTFQVKHIRVTATGREDIDGQMIIDSHKGTMVKVLQSFDNIAYYEFFANRLGDEKQSAVLGSFSIQKRMWNKKPPRRF
ncbi:hypothetical protein SOVF_140830 isoform A [Spinacia oleracea]|nr:hypothetical protein SOVF_140830 isoform A [Spinacia oleracea]